MYARQRIVHLKQRGFHKKRKCCRENKYLQQRWPSQRFYNRFCDTGSIERRPGSVLHIHSVLVCLTRQTKWCKGMMRQQQCRSRLTCMHKEWKCRSWLSCEGAVYLVGLIGGRCTASRYAMWIQRSDYSGLVIVSTASLQMLFGRTRQPYNSKHTKGFAVEKKVCTLVRNHMPSTLSKSTYGLELDGMAQ